MPGGKGDGLPDGKAAVGDGRDPVVAQGGKDVFQRARNDGHQPRVAHEESKVDVHGGLFPGLQRELAEAHGAE